MISEKKKDAVVKNKKMHLSKSQKIFVEVIFVGVVIAFTVMIALKI